MLNNLGRKLLIILIALPLSASVEMVAPDHFMEGEALGFQIVARGFEIKIPDIHTIEGYPVENIKTSEEAVIIDTRKASKITKTYRLSPQRSITIPSFTIEIDQEHEKTKGQKVELKKITKTISEDFDLQMQLNKSDAYIGEELLLSVVFAHKELEDYTLPEVDFSDFLVKELNTKAWIRADGQRVEEIRYALTPQAAGSLRLHPLKAEVEVLESGYKNLNNRSRYTQKRSLYSNELTLNVTALPKNLSLFGAYKLKASVDKQQVHAGEAVTLTLTVEGVGNIDDLDSLELEIPGTTVYSRSADKNEDDSIGRYSKKFEIVSDKNFTIPAVVLNYLDKTSRIKKTIQSSAFEIKVTGSKLLSGKPKREEEAAQEMASREKTGEKEEEVTGMEKGIYFAMGIISTLVLMMLYGQFRNRRRKREPALAQVLKQIKTQEALFKKMVPYIGRERALDRLIYQLEGKESVNFKAIKKEIIRKVQRL